jgi:hypothetical protein
MGQKIERIDTMDQLKKRKRQTDLIALQVADQVPMQFHRTIELGTFKGTLDEPPCSPRPRKRGSAPGLSPSQTTFLPKFRLPVLVFR